jgi:hypothetical protein
MDSNATTWDNPSTVRTPAGCPFAPLPIPSALGATLAGFSRQRWFQASSHKSPDHRQTATIGILCDIVEKSYFYVIRCH